MNDNAPKPVPVKQSHANAKFGCLLVLMIVLGGLLAFLRYGPFWLAQSAPVSTADRSGRIEVLQSQIDSLNRRVQTLEGHVESLLSAPAASQTQTQPAPATPPPDNNAAANLAHMQNDMIALSSALTALQAEVKATAATTAAAHENALTLVASVVAYIQLRETSSAGRPFIGELAALRDAAKGDAALQVSIVRLEPYAASGAPPVAVLRQQLLEREPAIAVAVAKGNAQSWWQRVLAELQGMVTVRSLHGGETDALAELESALTDNNTAAALDSYKNLPPDAQSNLTDWRKQLETRQKIDEEIATLAKHFTTTAPEAKTP